VAEKRAKNVQNELGVKAVTAFEASKIYPGIAERQFARMCLKGQRLKKLYGDAIPVKEMKAAIFGKKFGKYWLIPITELDRISAP
jgi:hypothetical protein